MPPAAPPLREVVTVAGDHSLKAGVAAVGPAVSAWLAKVLRR
jgi:hypothetical protein